MHTCRCTAAAQDFQVRPREGGRRARVSGEEEAQQVRTRAREPAPRPHACCIILGIETGGRMSQNFHKYIEVLLHIKTERDLGVLNFEPDPAVAKEHELYTARVKNVTT